MSESMKKSRDELVAQRYRQISDDLDEMGRGTFSDIEMANWQPPSIRENYIFRRKALRKARRFTHRARSAFNLYRDSYDASFTIEDAQVPLNEYNAATISFAQQDLDIELEHWQKLAQHAVEPSRQHAARVVEKLQEAITAAKAATEVAYGVEPKRVRK